MTLTVLLRLANTDLSASAQSNPSTECIKSPTAVTPSQAL